VRRILIAGCGYVGSVAADLLQAAGWQVEGWTRSSEAAARLSHKPYKVQAVDLSEMGAVATATQVFDVIVHGASTRGGDATSYERLYLDGVQNLQRRWPDAKIVFTSSTSVYAQIGGEVVNEESPAQPEPKTGKILRAAEDFVLTHGGTVARLGGIYGPGRAALLRRFLLGEAVLDFQHDRFVNQAHRDDVAAALVLLAGEGAPGIYNVVDDEPILLSECYRWFAEKLNRPLPPLGDREARRKRGESNKRVSNAKLRACGWEPEFPSMAKGMEESVLPGLPELL
jgi:nucleoside-diphosphate-sugar epimerase